MILNPPRTKCLVIEIVAFSSPFRRSEMRKYAQLCILLYLLACGGGKLLLCDCHSTVECLGDQILFLKAVLRPQVSPTRPILVYNVMENAVNFYLFHVQRLVLPPLGLTPGKLATIVAMVQLVTSWRRSHVLLHWALILTKVPVVYTRM